MNICLSQWKQNFKNILWEVTPSRPVEFYNVSEERSSIFKDEK